MLQSLVSKLCCNTDLAGLRSAVAEAVELADHAAVACDRASAAYAPVSGLSRGVRESLEALGDGGEGLADPATYVKIKYLVDDDKLSRSLSLVSDLGDLAVDVAKTSVALAAALDRGVDSLPDPVRDNILEDGGEDADDDDADEGLPAVIQEVDRGVADLEDCRAGLQEMNLFSAAKKGSRAFRSLDAQGELCKTIFAKIKKLAATVRAVAAALAGAADASVCTQVRTLAAEFKDMVKCLRLTKIITEAANAVKRLIEAIIALFNTAGPNFKKFFGQFKAATNLKHFAKKANKKLKKFKKKF